MKWTDTEIRWRDAVFASLLPAPGGGLPALEDVDLGEFWPMFEGSAPAHLKLAFRLACAALGGVVPRLQGHTGSLADLDAEQRDRIMAHAGDSAVFGQLVEVVKIVACLAYFADSSVQATGRERGAAGRNYAGGNP